MGLDLFLALQAVPGSHVSEKEKKENQIMNIKE
jgi:hypothetical protein